MFRNFRSLNFSLCLFSRNSSYNSSNIRYSSFKHHQNLLNSNFNRAKYKSNHIENIQQTSVNLSLGLRKTCKLFHTTSQRSITPVAVLILRPLTKFAAIIVGRGIRKWWKHLPKDKKKLLLTHVLRNKWKYLAALFFLGGSTFYLYESHVSITPYTERKRFMLFNSEQIKKIADIHSEMDLEAYEDNLLPDTHPHVLRTKRICDRLLQGNREIPEIYTKSWSVAVVDTAQENCQVYPTGQILMFTGMLELADNDDQLAVVLAHEMSHVVLEHSAELFNYGTLLDLAIIVPLALAWALIPSDGVAVVTHWFLKRVVDVLLQLPYSRKLEAEADALGIFLAASACFDIREASAFWGRLDLIGKIRSSQPAEETPEVAFLNTHPSHSERQHYLDQLMENAIKTRIDRKCPHLGKIDPRDSVRALQKQLAASDQEKTLSAIKLTQQSIKK